MSSRLSTGQVCGFVNAYFGFIISDGAGNIFIFYRTNDHFRWLQSSDKGETWSQWSISTWTNYRFCERLRATSSGNITYLVFEYDTTGADSDIGFLRTTDNGLSWGGSWIGIAATTRNERRPDITMVGTNWVGCVYEREWTVGGDHDIVYRYTTSRTNPGTNWTGIVLLYTTADERDPQVDARGNIVSFGSWVAGTPDHLRFRGSTDGGANWGTPSNAFWFGQASRYPTVAVGVGDTMHAAIISQSTDTTDALLYIYSTDGGTNWSTTAEVITGVDNIASAVARRGIRYAWIDYTSGWLRAIWTDSRWVVWPASDPTAKDSFQIFSAVRDPSKTLLHQRPDLIYSQLSGWSYPIVPSNISGTGTVSSQLTGGGITFLDYSYKDSSGICISKDSIFFTTVLRDSAFSVHTTTETGLPGGWWRWQSDLGVVIPGGRHVLSLHVDHPDSIGEMFETNNLWHRQWVWSPILLTDKVPYTASSPPYFKAFGVDSPFYNCDGYSISPPSGQWSIVGIRPPDTANYDLILCADYINSTTGFSDYLLFSRNANNGVIDFIVINGYSIPGTYYPAVYAPTTSDTGSYIVQWGSRTDSLGQNEFYGPYRIGRDTVVLVFDIEVILDSSYTISFIDSTDPVQADLAMAVFSNATNLQRRGEWVAMVDSIGPVREQELTFTATSSGIWSIAVWNKYLPGKAPPGRALIFLHREVCPLSVELVNFWADADVGEVSLKWRVAGETDNLRWILTRAETEDGEFLRIAELRGRGTTPQETTYIYIDEDVVSGNTYYYKLADIDRNGDTTWHGPLSAVPGGPRITKIERNYPNPFMEGTVIGYQLSVMSP